MTIYYINTGTGPNAGNGDSLRVAFNKINNNFVEIIDQLSTIEVGTTSTLVAGTYTFALSTSGDVTLNGEPFVSGGGLTGTSWNLTSQGNGCPIDVTLTTTTFDVRVPRNHLLFNEDGSWDIGSYTNGNYITGDTFTNFNIVTNFDQNVWTFGADGSLAFPTAGVSFDYFVPTIIGKDRISFSTYDAGNSTSSYAGSLLDNKTWEAFTSAAFA